MNDATRSDEARTKRLADLFERGLAADEDAFDPQRHLIGQPAANDPQMRTYRQAMSLPYAHALLRQGKDEAAGEAAAIVAAVLESQELTAHHPYRGNWRWLADDPEVGDLNAVQFVLRSLLPLLVEQGDQLPPDLLALCRERVRLALHEEERLDVAPTYTNIHLMSLFALLVGGEWLADEHFLHLGKTRWQRWVAYTVGSGAPHEYNSPNYGGVDLSTLAALAQHVQDERIQLQARLLYERFWLHLALHLHRPTRQLAGPHCRCYWGTMQSGLTSVKDIIWRETGWSWLLEPGAHDGSAPSAPQLPTSLELALTDHWLPAYLVTWLEQQPDAMPYEVRETADQAKGYDLTTYFTPEFALGVASRTYAIGTDCFYIEHQADYLLLHYARPQAPGGWGMMYSRYVVNDQHWGTLAAAPDRPKTNNFYDQGHFAGVQLHNKAIGLYALKPQHDEVFSLKTVVAFQTGATLDEIWVNDRSIHLDDLAAQPITADDWLIVRDGSVYVGIRPLQPSRLGSDAPICLERGPLGELWLSIYNYRGAPKRFWDYASLGGAFWRGNLRAGYVVEVAGQTDFHSAAAFLTHLRRATVADSVDADHVRTVTYQSGDEELAISYDLWQTNPGERWLNGQLYQPPNLASPLAVQGDTGALQVGQARLTTNPQPVWVVAQELDGASRAWVAANPQDRPTPLRLETPAGVVTAQAWGLGRLEWRAPLGGDQVLLVDGVEPPEGLVAPEHVSVVWRGC